MRQIDLKCTFLGGRTTPKDFQNEAGTVNDLCLPFLFKIALLHGVSG